MGRKTDSKLKDVDSLCGEVIFWLFVGMCVLLPISFGGTATWAFSLAKIMVACSLILWSVKLWMNNAHRFFVSPAVWTVVAILAYAFMEYLRSPIEYDARNELFYVLFYSAVFLLFVNNLRSREHSKILTLCIIGVGTLISLYAVAQYVTGSSSILGLPQPEIYAHRSSGTYTCPNHLAGFLEMIIPLALAMTLSGKVGQLLRVFLGFSTLVMLAAVAVTFSRGGYIATFLGVATVLVVLIRKPRYRIPALVTVVCIAVGAVWFMIRSPLTTMRGDSITTKTALVEGRGAIYQTNLKMMEETPLLGMGSGSYRSLAPRFLPEKMQNDPITAHSDFMQLYIEWGLIGFLLILTLLGFATLGGIKTWKYVQQSEATLNPKDSTRAALFLGTIGGLIAILCHSFIDFNMLIPANALLAVILLAFLTSCLRFRKKSCWMKQTTANRIALTILVVLCFGLLTHEAIYSAYADRLIKEGGNIKLPVNERADLLHRASKLDLRNWYAAQAEADFLQTWGYQTRSPEQMEAVLIRSLEAYDRGVVANKYSYVLHGGKAYTLTLLGRHAEALAEAKEMLRLCPNSYFSHAIYGWCALYREDYDQAVNSLEKSIHLLNEGNDFAKEWYEVAIKRQSEQKGFD